MTCAAQNIPSVAVSLAECVQELLHVHESEHKTNYKGGKWRIALDDVLKGCTGGILHCFQTAESGVNNQFCGIS